MTGGDTEYWFATQSEFIFYGSSLLFTYDTTLEQPELRVKMIDFAHVTVSFSELFGPGAHFRSLA
ncbi:MAG: inositol polyphosphate kinase family protein [Promethearchaeia archaeon]